MPRLRYGGDWTWAAFCAAGYAGAAAKRIKLSTGWVVGQSGLLPSTRSVRSASQAGGWALAGSGMAALGCNFAIVAAAGTSRAWWWWPGAALRNRSGMIPGVDFG